MSLSQDITALKTMLVQAEKEIISLEAGKKASSARARKALQGIKSNSHKLRKDIIEHMKTLPVKKKPSRSKAVETTTEVEPNPKPKPSKKTATKRPRSKQAKPEADVIDEVAL